MVTIAMVYIYNNSQTNVGWFEKILCKTHIFFYYAPTSLQKMIAKFKLVKIKVINFVPFQLEWAENIVPASKSEWYTPLVPE